MSIFNSLGSNYTFHFVLHALFTANDKKHSFELKSLLENKYGGKAILLYKGREAIEAALKLLHLPKGTFVAINGFTCYAVYKAIVNADYKVAYIDIDTSDLHFSAQSLHMKLKENPRIKVLIIQNTLGYPCDSEEIRRVCKQKNIILIEDLAHSAGTTYPHNRQAGTIGDFTVLSFSQDKMIDGISGGALIIRNDNYKNLSFYTLSDLGNKQQLRDRFYPLFTYVIRKTYSFGLGRLFHAILKKMNLLSIPMGNQMRDILHNLPDWYCYLIKQQFDNLDTNLRQRRKIASIYIQNIRPAIFSSKMPRNISLSTHLRFPILVENRNSLIRYLKRYEIHISDIWYDAPIAPEKYMHVTDYTNQCPVAEKISKQILNLPTHRNVSAEDAQNISHRINQWLKSQ